MIRRFCLSAAVHVRLALRGARSCPEFDAAVYAYLELLLAAAVPRSWSCSRPYDARAAYALSSAVLGWLSRSPINS